MTTSVPIDNSYNLLDHLSTAPNHRMRRNINILFLGFAPDEIDPLLSLIRTGRMAPRGRQISSQQDLSQALTERSWDLLLSTTHQPKDMTPQQAITLLHQMDKDLPVIVLAQDSGLDAQLHAYQEGFAAILPQEPGELLLHIIQREVNALTTRRKLRHTEAMLEVAERHYHEQIASSRTAICYVQNGQLIFANDSLKELLSYEQVSHLVGRSLERLILPEQREQTQELIANYHDQHLPVDLRLNLHIVRADNSSFEADVQFQTCRHKGEDCMIVSIRPEQVQDETSPDANADTSLHNRVDPMQALDEATQLALSGGHDAHLLYLRLDHLEKLRANYSTDSCNALINTITTTLQTLSSKELAVGRLEEDSFALLYRNASNEKARQLARKLVQRIAGISVNTDQGRTHLTCTVGIVVINDSAPPASELIRRARLAVDSVKEGNDYVQYISPSASQTSQDEGAIRRILDAICDCRLKLMFQPVVELDPGEKTHNYEVLIRLLDENDTILPPNLFMTVVEQSDVMIKMDRWVLERSLQVLHDAKQEGHRNRLFINLAGRTFNSNSLLKWFAAQLDELDIEPDQIVFQISETDAAASLNQARRFGATVRKMKCHLCLKHFGSSPNSHRVFEMIDPDYIKIDGSYVQDLENDNLDEKELKRLLSPAIKQRKVIIAPLVESTRVIGKLFHCHVQLIQGYYLQPPREKMDYDFFEGS